jgi:hypothetical protein
MSEKTKLRIAWCSAAIGCVVRLSGDLSHSATARTFGDAIALFGFASVLICTLLPKVGSYRSSPDANN